MKSIFSLVLLIISLSLNIVGAKPVLAQTINTNSSTKVVNTSTTTSTLSLEEEKAAIKAKGKVNTEIMIVSVAIFLVGLVGVGYVLQNLKKKKTTKVSKENEDTEIVNDVSKENQSSSVSSPSKSKSNLILIPLLILLNGISNIASASAFCPVCLVGVGAGLGLAQYFHIDDSITGLWLGAMTIATVVWFLTWLEGRKIKNVWISIATYLLTYGAVFFAIYSNGYITNHYEHILFGIDKMIIGPVLGSVILYVGSFLNLYLKKRNNGVVYFPFQKVVIPIGLVWITTVVFYFLVYN